MRHLFSCAAALVLVAACGPGPTPETPKPGEGGGASPQSSGEPAPASAPPESGRLAENKKAFMDGCQKGGPGTEGFCECAWNEIRAVVGDAKMGTEGPTDKDLIDSHPRVMAACKAKMPEAAVKQGFVQGCVGDRQEMTPYCECSWDEFRKDFSAGDLGDESVIQSPKFASSRIAVTKACGSKISEKVVKEGFMKACARDPQLEKFCGCAWGELKKMASPAEIEAGLIEKDKLTSTLEKQCGKLKPQAK